MTRARLAASLLCALIALAPRVAQAQGASYAQYLVVLDDSGSMDESDPRRLVVMASFALASALEDGDQVMLVGLNELASGSVTSPRFVSPRELLPDRAAAEGVRPLAGERATRIATHAGETPCRAALDRARDILEASASAGAPQTLLMLTDGACNGGAVEPADRWLAGLRAHREGRFRFVFLTNTCSGGRTAGCERMPLAQYTRSTGWQGDLFVALDARALLRAFADVLSFSRGLRYDEGGRIGLERTFAGARTVRVLAIRDRGDGPIGLERIDRNGATALIAGGPTHRDATHAWSFRSASADPRVEPFAVRSTTTGVDVLVIPVYGRLRVEALIAPCGEPPAPPWSTEVPVRAGQPACAFARLSGDGGDTIVPGGSFDFGIDLCDAADCATSSAMQPGEGGLFHAQLGAAIETGRHERTFRASGGALAAPIATTRGFAAMSFGVSRVVRTAEPERAIASIDLGTIPQAASNDLLLRYSGAFPSGARGSARCEIEGVESIQACVRCEVIDGADLPLRDALEVHAIVRGRPFCPLISEGDGQDRPVRMRLVLEPADTTEVTAHVLPITATLRYALADPIAIALTAGGSIEHAARVPGPLAQTPIEIRAEGFGDDPTVASSDGPLEVHAGGDGTIVVPLRASAADCCGAGPREGTLVLSADGSELRVPIRLEVTAASFWICPGKQIAMAIAGLLALALLIWLVHGMITPAKFSHGALLLSASSQGELISLREGDDGWRLLRRFAETKRGFRRPAAIWLGGPRAPLPSLKRQPADARIEAQPGGGAQLVVTGQGVARWNESEGKFLELDKGTYPVPSRVRLQRGDELFLEFRR